MKKLSGSFFLLIFCSTCLLAQTPAYPKDSRVELDISKEKIQKFSYCKPVKEFEIIREGDSLRIVPTGKKDAKKYYFQKISEDTSKKELLFEQRSHSHPNYGIQYKIVKDLDGNVNAEIQSKSVNFEADGVNLWYCTNHPAKHACKVTELKDCAKDNGCEF